MVLVFMLDTRTANAAVCNENAHDALVNLSCRHHFTARLGCQRLIVCIRQKVGHRRSVCCRGLFVESKVVVVRTFGTRKDAKFSLR